MAVAHGREAADELGPARRERVEVEVRAIRRADELRRGHVAGADEVVDLVVALVEAADPVEPPHDVAAPVGARHADVLADRDGDLAAGAQQLVGDLDAGGRGADDQDAARPQPVRPLVVERRDLVDRCGQVGREGGDARDG